MLINKNDTIAIVIDIQEKLFPFVQDSLKFQQNTIKLIEGLKVLNIPILVTEQYPKGLGSTIKPIQITLGEDYKVIEKDTMSCCGNESFNTKLKSYQKRNVILCGIEAHVCVLQTAIDLQNNGFNVTIVEDCVSSRNPNDKKIAIARIWNMNGTVSTYETVLMELLQVSGTNEFKAISKIIK